MIVAVNCTVKAVGQVKFGNRGFKSREIVIVTDESEPQVLRIGFKNENVNMLDGVMAGDKAVVHFSIRGREWYNPGTYKTMVFNMLDGEKIAVAGKSDMSIPEDYKFDENY